MRKFIIALLAGIALLGSHAAHAQYNREYFFWMGRTCMMNNNYQEAIRTLNILLRFDEDAFEGYFLRGIAKYNLDDLLGAEEDFSTAIRLNPVYTQAYTYRAITRSRLGNYDDALQDFREAIELRPDLPGPYYSRGVTRLLNQQFKEAISDFDKFIRQENKVADAYICRGLSYLHLKDTVKAYENFNTAIRTNREDPNGYNRRGGLYLEQERYKEAEADFNKANTPVTAIKNSANWWGNRPKYLASLLKGWFGDAASISAVGTGSTFMQMVTLIITSLAMGTTVTIGQHIGEKKPEEAGNAIGTTILLFAVVGVVLTILLEIFAGPLAGILQVPAESFDKTVLYIRICSGGILVIIAYNVISGILRGVGNANLPFLFVGIACVVNIVGDLLLVGVFHMDVAGAAIATVLAQFVSVVVSLAVL